MIDRARNRESLTTSDYLLQSDPGHFQKSEGVHPGLVRGGGFSDPLSPCVPSPLMKSRSRVSRLFLQGTYRRFFSQAAKKGSELSSDRLSDQLRFQPPNSRRLGTDVGRPRELSVLEPIPIHRSRTFGLSLRAINHSATRYSKQSPVFRDPIIKHPKSIDSVSTQPITHPVTFTAPNAVGGVSRTLIPPITTRPS